MPTKCALCFKRIADDQDKISDPRWVNPVHEGCLRWLNHWPDYAKNGAGIYGTDDSQEGRYDYGD